MLWDTRQLVMLIITMWMQNNKLRLVGLYHNQTGLKSTQMECVKVVCDRAGCGGLIWGDGGEWLCGFSKFLKLTQRYGFSKVEVHADCKVVVKNLTRDGVVGVAEFQLVQKFR